MTARQYDAVTIGGGHNALVAAAYLARAGKRVLVLEKLASLGGAAKSDQPFAGHEARLSRYSYLVSLLPERIVRDLGIEVELRTRRVVAYAPEGLIVDDDPSSERTRASLGGDHEAWLDFYALCSAAARRLFPTLLEPVPARAEVRRLLTAVPGAWEALAERPLGETLRERFEDGLVRGVVSTDALIGTFASIDDPALSQNACFLWHVIGGPWRVPVGGMEAITEAIAKAAAQAGAELRTNAEVVHVDGHEVTWRQGDVEHATCATHVLSGVAPSLLESLRGHTGLATAGCQMKLNMLLDRLPRLRSGIAAEDAFAGTFRLDEHEDDIAAAYDQASKGELPARPPAELYCHSLTDRSILGDGAPPEQQTLTLFGLHTPAQLFERDNDAARATLTERYLDALDEHLENPIRECLARDAYGRPCIEAKTPLDLERELSMPAGNIFHGELGFPWAQTGGGWGVETDDPRILTCGAGALRGGGVSGIGGHNAAMAILRPAGRQLRPVAAQTTARALRAPPPS
jgi:phytoene dehydrogenase-like protein